MRKNFLFLIFLVWAVEAGIAATIQKGDRVELVSDAPLFFKETTLIRVAKTGERFTVLLVQPAQHRVFVSARDDLGNEIALSVADTVLQIAKDEAAPLEAGRKIPATMAARLTPKARDAALQAAGGSKENDEAVLRGLRWLVKTQNPNGSWGVGSRAEIAAVTGFSILSFLGHGEIPASPEFGPAIGKAVDWVIENGSKNEGRLSMEPAFSQMGVYAHGIATFALGEYYAMTKDERVAPLLKQAVGYIVDGQGPDGGWMYAYDKSESDTSVSGWQIQALRAASLSGLNIDGVDKALNRAMDDLIRVQGKRGGFGYRNAASEKYSLTGVGVYCLGFWQGLNGKKIRDGIRYIMDETRKTFPVDYRHDKADLYAWYYDTQACFLVGGPAWDTWNRPIQTQLIKNQSADGSWPPMISRGVANLQSTSDGIGPVYRTNLCILMLEVYYRYLPPARQL